MKEVIQTQVPSDIIWEAWERAFTNPARFRYKVLEVIPKKSFTILWKALFVRLVFTHTVTPIRRGSEISYEAKIKGFFAIPVRWILGKKIQKNLHLVLKAFVDQLEKKQR